MGEVRPTDEQILERARSLDCLVTHLISCPLDCTLIDEPNNWEAKGLTLFLNVLALPLDSLSIGNSSRKQNTQTLKCTEQICS